MTLGVGVRSSGAAMLACHVMMRLVDGRVLAPTPAARRMLARVMLDVGRRYRLLCFRAPDGHVHALPACDRVAAGTFAQTVEAALRKRLGLPVPFGPAHIVPVEDQRHLEHAFDYILRNEARHGAATDVLHDASNLPDLLGMRIIGAWTAEHVRALLPRTRTSRLLEILGAPSVAAEWNDDLAVEAAAGALGLPDLGGHDGERRRGQVEVARGWTGTRRGLAEALAVGETTLRRLRTLPEDPALARAIRLQIGLRTALAEANRAALSEGPMLLREPTDGGWATWGRGDPACGAPEEPPNSRL